MNFVNGYMSTYRNKLGIKSLTYNVYQLGIAVKANQKVSYVLHCKFPNQATPQKFRSSYRPDKWFWMQDKRKIWCLKCIFLVLTIHHYRPDEWRFWSLLCPPSYVNVEQGTLLLLLSTGWFQERIRAWFT